MIVKLISEKGFLVKIGVLLMLLVLGRGLRENGATLTSENKIIGTQELQVPSVLTTTISEAIFPYSVLTTSIN